MAIPASPYKIRQVIPGTVYRIVRRLGAGGMGTVYEVEDTTIEKRYVVKTLHADLVRRADMVESLVAEAKILAKLRHKNIVDVVTAGKTADELAIPYYVMEKLDGANLRALIGRGAMPFDHFHSIATDILEALHFVHHPDGNRPIIIHRDLKPENVFLCLDVDRRAVAKVLDFGIMAVFDGKRQEGFFGTLRYAAPEQLRGDVLTPRTDLYAIALVFYEMLAGRHPFADARGESEIVQAQLFGTPPPLSSLVRVPPSVEAAIMRGLAKSPADRPSDAYAFLQGIDDIRRVVRGISLDVSARTDEMLDAALTTMVKAEGSPYTPYATSEVNRTDVGMTEPPLDGSEPRLAVGGDTLQEPARPVGLAPTEQSPQPPAPGIDRNAVTRERRADTRPTPKNGTEEIHDLLAGIRTVEIPPQPTPTPRSKVSRTGTEPMGAPVAVARPVARAQALSAHTPTPTPTPTSVSGRRAQPAPRRGPSARAMFVAAAIIGAGSLVVLGVGLSRRTSGAPARPEPAATLAPMRVDPPESTSVARPSTSAAPTAAAPAPTTSTTTQPASSAVATASAVARPRPTVQPASPSRASDMPPVLDFDGVPVSKGGKP